jgi:MFS family permease
VQHGESGTGAARLAALGVLAVGIMAPVTMPVPVLRELVHDRFGVSELLTSLFMSINMVGALVAAPFVGALVDRVGRPRAILTSALLLDSLCFVTLTAPVPFGLFLAVRFLEGGAHIGALSVLLASASNALEPARRGRAMGLVGGSMMLGVAFGAPIGGLLGRGGPLLPLQVGGAVLLACAAFAWLAVRDRGAAAGRPGFAAIVGALRAHPRILVPLAFSFADRFTVGFFTTTFSLYVRRIHELPPARIGLAIAIFMVPFALLSYPVGRLAERGYVVALLCGGSLLYAAATATVGYVAPPGLYLLMFGIGVTAAVMFVPSMLLTTQLAPESIRATALGAFNAAGSLGFVLGPLAGGFISQAVATQSGWATALTSQVVADQTGWHAGYRAAFVAAGASVALCVLATFPILLRIARERRG